MAERSTYDPSYVSLKYPGGDVPNDRGVCTVPPHLPHIMIVSDKNSADGTPLVIHNIGRGTREEDSLFAFPLTGHFRWKSGS